MDGMERIQLIHTWYKMKKLLISFTVLFIIILGALLQRHCHAQHILLLKPESIGTSFNELKMSQKRSMHTIVSVSEERALCTAYAISPHALLTADHCIQQDMKIYIDQPKIKLIKDSYISEILFDHHDHIIIIFPNEVFKDFLEYNPAEPLQGEHVYFWGNPKGLTDQYREGYVSGYKKIVDPEEIDLNTPIYLFVFNVIPGDSGSPIFDSSDGHLVSLITYSEFDGHFGGGYNFAFTKEQIIRARQ